MQDYFLGKFQFNLLTSPFTRIHIWNGSFCATKQTEHLTTLLCLKVLAGFCSDSYMGRSLFSCNFSPMNFQSPVELACPNTNHQEFSYSLSITESEIELLLLELILYPKLDDSFSERAKVCLENRSYFLQSSLSLK